MGRYLPSKSGEEIFWNNYINSQINNNLQLPSQRNLERRFDSPTNSQEIQNHQPEISSEYQGWSPFSEGYPFSNDIGWNECNSSTICFDA